MIDTKIVTKTGKDFANIFYNIPEDLRTDKTEGTAVGKLKFEIAVDGMLFLSRELNFYGAGASEPYGRITVPQLGEGEYGFRITETEVSIEKSVYGKKKIRINENTGTFVIGETQSPPSHEYQRTKHTALS